MRLLFVVDPLPDLKACKDSSVAMMRAAAARGHEIWATSVDRLRWECGERGEGVAAEAVALTIAADDRDWYRAHAAQTLRLADCGAVLMRKDPPFDIEYVTATWLLEQAEREGARVFNRPRALRDHSEKLALAEFAGFAPPSLVTRDATRLAAFIEREGDTILKPLDGMGGRGVFRVRGDDPNRNVIIETLSGDGARSVMAQRFLPAIADGDKRVLLIGGEVVPYCLARVPKPGETRGNLAVGGFGEVRPLTARDREIGAALAPVMAARGLLFVGIDVIGDCLTEINVTSPTCMVEIAKGSDVDPAALFVAALERACAS
ncbi:MAG: glutathione synthase [Rhodocyclales bacterium]|nr:glutathione synthase [Rhodocyclales bacterium]